MLRLSRIFKNYNETGSLGEQINLYGFIVRRRSHKEWGSGRCFGSARSGLRMS